MTPPPNTTQCHWHSEVIAPSTLVPIRADPNYTPRKGKPTPQTPNVQDPSAVALT